MRVLDDWQLTAERAAIHLPTRTVVVADLHLGYERCRHRAGEAVPWRSLADELTPLQRLLHREELSRLVIAGDLFEDARREREELLDQLVTWLDETEVELVGIVPGNHDKGLERSSLSVFKEGILLDHWLVVHGDRPLPDQPCIQGHEHPRLRWREASGPCYLFQKQRLILPAYSADAAGVNVLHEPRWQDMRVAAIAGERVLDFGRLAELRRRLPSLVQ